MKAGRTQHILNRLGWASCIALQGTRFRAGSVPVEEWSQCGYRIFSSGYSNNRSCGVMWAIKEDIFPKESVRQILVPGSHLQGRALALRIKHKSTDMRLVNVYYPLCNNRAPGQQWHQLTNWLLTVLRGAAIRSLPLVVGDFNARIAPSLDHNGLRQHSSVAGQHGPVPNQQGSLLLEHFESLNLFVMGSDAVHPDTYYSCTSPHTSKIDYIVCSQRAASENTVFSYKTLTRVGPQLQCMKVARQADHVPISVQVCMVSVYYTKPSTCRWDTDSLMAAGLRGDRRQAFFDRIDSTF